MTTSTLEKGTGTEPTGKLGPVKRAPTLTAAPEKPQLPRLVWGLLPLLAVVAFAPVLGLWFVGDDFQHLRFTERLPWPLPFTQFQGGAMFYRPLSATLTWELGVTLFGTNALPYHALSLALHALAAWLVGKMVAGIADDERTGWIAGAIFAVYPLCTEPVAWLASQWDEWALVCALAAVWGFAHWWRTGSRRAYLLGLLAAFLGVMMKESTLPLPLVLPFVALATQLCSQEGVLYIRDRWAFARKALLATLPYAIPTAIFALLRVSTGGIGGYPGAKTDFQHFFWDSLVAATLQIIMPLNRELFSRAAVQAVGLAMSVCLLVGLVVWGRRQWPLVLLGFAWATAFILPELNLVDPEQTTTFGNRLLFFSFVGLCIVMSALITAAMEALPKLAWRRTAWALLGVALAAGVAATWVQLQPWVQASNQTRQMMGEMKELIVPLPQRLVTINVQGMPRLYHGSHVFWNGFDDAMHLFAGQTVLVAEVETLDGSKLSKPYTNTSGLFNLAFSFDAAKQLFHVSGLEATTIATHAPTASRHVWDFSTCSKQGTGEWQPANAQFGCVGTPGNTGPGRGEYAAVAPQSADPSLALPTAGVDLTGAKWLRLGVMLRFPAREEGRLLEWFWRGAGQSGWTPGKSHSTLLEPNGNWRVYWAYIPAEQIGNDLAGLRLDPVNAQLPVDIAWISVDAIK